MSVDREVESHGGKLARRAFIAGMLIACGGCQYIVRRSQNQDDLNTALASSNDGTQYVGSVTGVWGLDFAKIEGIGLVTGLDGSGSDPGPSWQREHLLNELKTHEGIESPIKLLANENNSLVLVKGLIPPGAKKGDIFDLEVTTPPKSDTDSLKFGFLGKTRLRAMAVMGRRVREGNAIGVGRGSVLVDSLFENRQDQSNQIHGWILGGGISTEDRTMGLTVRSEDNALRKATSIARAINNRFTTVTREGRVGVATPKSDKIVNLLVPDPYQKNVGRYVQVLSQIAFDETANARVNRLAQLDRELQQPAMCRDAAIRLEAIGPEGAPALKRGLANNDLEVQFHSAQALAYLGEPDGIDVLESVAASEPAFRWHALTALSAMKDPQAGTALSNLMHAESAETRYGAFRAYQTRSPEEALSKGDWLADDFYFHVVPSTATPMLHVSRSKRPEVVVFGEQQTFDSSFLYVVSGLTIKGDGKGSMLLIRYSPEKGEERRVCSPSVIDVIRNLAALNCSYTMLTGILRDAKQQEKLSSRFVINAVPKLNRDYQPDSESEPVAESSNRYIRGQLPDLFRTGDNSDPVIPRDDEAQFQDVSTDKESSRASARTWTNWFGKR